mgnify:CR=1 FL=1
MASSVTRGRHADAPAHGPRQYHDPADAGDEIVPKAAAIYPPSPFAPYNLATLFTEEKQGDSAVKYFQIAANATS